MKSYQVYGLGNAIVDLVARVDDGFLAKHSFGKGSSDGFSPEGRELLLSDLKDGNRDIRMSPGGSVANSLAIIADVRGKSAFSGRIADDHLGEKYRDEFERIGVHFGNPLVVNDGHTGVCVVLTTPDGERTMRVTLGTNNGFGPDEVVPHLIDSSEWLYYEGYLLAHGSKAKEAFELAIDRAHSGSNRAKIALSLSSDPIAENHREYIRSILPRVDLLIANRSESMTLTKTESPEVAFTTLKSLCPNVVATQGADGALFRIDGVEGHEQQQYKPRVIDTTGAGDAFAGGLLFGLTRGYAPAQSVRFGNFLASKVIEQIGARLGEDAYELWREEFGHLTPGK